MTFMGVETGGANLSWSMGWNLDLEGRTWKKLDESELGIKQHFCLKQEQ